MLAVNQAEAPSGAGPDGASIYCGGCASDRLVEVALHLAQAVLQLALELVHLALGLQALVARKAADGVLHVAGRVLDLALERVVQPALGKAAFVCHDPLLGKVFRSPSASGM